MDDVEPPGISNHNQVGCRIETPQIIRIACHDRLAPLSGKNNYRSVDDIRRACDRAELPTGTGKLLIKRNDLDFLAPQESG